MPDISIIIPTQNRVELLRRLLSSIYGQDHSRAEIIVVDDNSSDLTQSMIASGRWPSLRYSRNSATMGAAAARNRGAAIAGGSWLWFVDDDDELHDGSIKEVAGSLSESADVLVCLVETLQSDGTRQIPNRQQLPTDLDRTTLLTLTRRPITSSQVVMRSELFHSIGRFDETLRSSNDIDLWQRIVLSEAARVVVLSRVLLTKHEHSSTQLSRNLPAAFADQRAFLRKWSSEMKSRLGEEQFATWYCNRLMAMYYFHCGRATPPFIPLGRLDSFKYAASWWALLFQGNRKTKKVAFEKLVVSLARACAGASIFSRLRAVW